MGNIAIICSDFKISSILYIFVTVIFIGLFLYSVHKESRRMLNCFLLCLGINMIWNCITIISWQWFANDINGFLAFPTNVLSFAFGVVLISNGIVIIRKEGFSIAHSLSLFTGILIMAILALYAVVMFNVLYGYTSDTTKILISLFNMCLTIITYVPLLTISFMLYSFFIQHKPEKHPADFIVVLGCGLRNDKVSPILASRLDKGIEYYKKHSEKPVFVVSGGKGSDEVISEAAAMRNYLLENKIPENKIIMENKSTTTRENLIFSKKIMESANPDYRCVIVTNNFHVLRAVILARNLGVMGNGIGCKTVGYYHPSASIREYAALILSYKKMFALYIAMAVFDCIFQLIYQYIRFNQWL